MIHVSRASSYFIFIKNNRCVVVPLIWLPLITLSQVSKINLYRLGSLPLLHYNYIPTFTKKKWNNTHFRILILNHLVLALNFVVSYIYVYSKAEKKLAINVFWTLTLLIVLTKECNSLKLFSWMIVSVSLIEILAIDIPISETFNYKKS